MEKDFYKMSDFINKFAPQKLVSNFAGTNGTKGVKLYISSLEKIQGEKAIWSKGSRTTKYIREDLLPLLAVWINTEECNEFIINRKYVDEFDVLGLERNVE